MTEPVDLRIVCVGANQESVVMLEGLHAHRALVVGIVTAPVESAGDISDYADVRAIAQSFGATVIETLDVNSAETLAAVRALRPDVIFVLGWSQLLKSDMLALAPRGVVGSHPSLLPEGRGRAPVPWTIIEGLTETGVTLFAMDEGVDSGAVLAQPRFAVPPGADAAWLYAAAAEHLRDAFGALVEQARAGQPWVAIEQDRQAGTTRGKRSPADGHLDFTRPVGELVSLVRAVTRPYPGAYAYHRDRKVVVWGATTDDAPPRRGTVGQVLARRSDAVFVQAGDGGLWLVEPTVGGRSAVADLTVGSCFGYRVQDELHSLRAEVAHLRALVDLLAGKVEDA